MVSKTVRLEVSTRGPKDVVDLTAQVAEAVRASGANEGMVHLFALGSTCALTTIELEAGLLEDFGKALDRLVPPRGNYAHALSGGDDNAASHIWSSVMGPSLAVPFEDGRLVLGTWQQIVLVELDVRPRRREVRLQVHPLA